MNGSDLSDVKKPGDPSPAPESGRESPVSGGRLVFGLVLVGLGLFFLLDRFGLVRFDLPWRWWPLILVALGVGKFLRPGDRGDAQGGVWLIFVGAWLIANFEGFFGLDWDNSWPLFLVAGGAMLVWRALSGDDRRARRRAERREHRRERLERRHEPQEEPR